MSIQALIELAKARKINEASIQLLLAARLRQREHDELLEQQVANKEVGHALLNRSCNL